MLHYLEREKIARIREASDKLVEPFRSVVDVAMQRVREGTIDSFINRQTVTLWDHETSRVYKITDSSVDELGGVVISTGFLDVGLFIVVQGLLSIQLPRDPNQVNKESLYSLRVFKPKDVKMLAVALSSAKKL